VTASIALSRGRPRGTKAYFSPPTPHGGALPLTVASASFGSSTASCARQDGP
jgi:hypothetical protein